MVVLRVCIWPAKFFLAVLQILSSLANVMPITMIVTGCVVVFVGEGGTRISPPPPKKKNVLPKNILYMYIFFITRFETFISKQDRV